MSTETLITILTVTNVINLISIYLISSRVSCLENLVFGLIAILAGKGKEQDGEGLH